MRTRIPFLTTLAAGTFLIAACDGGPSATAPEAASRGLTADGLAVSRTQAATATEPRVYRFRSVEDPDFPPDRSVCDQAGFTTNVFLGASLWSENSRAADGQVTNSAVRRVGTATACARITNPTFPPGLPQDFYVRFELEEGVVVAKGACTLVSNDVPRRGLVLAGCHLRVTEAPSWYVGGAATSLSVFNPARLDGFATGSDWTLQLYGGA